MPTRYLPLVYSILLLVALLAGAGLLYLHLRPTRQEAPSRVLRPTVEKDAQGQPQIVQRPGVSRPHNLLVPHASEGLQRPLDALVEAEVETLVHGLVEGRHFGIAASRVEATLRTRLRWRSRIVAVDGTRITEEREILEVQPSTLISPLGFGLAPEAESGALGLATAIDLLVEQYLGLPDAEVEERVQLLMQHLRNVLEVPWLGNRLRSWLEEHIRQHPDTQLLLMNRAIGRLAAVDQQRITVVSERGRVVSARFSASQEDLTSSERALALRVLSAVDLSLFPRPEALAPGAVWSIPADRMISLIASDLVDPEQAAFDGWLTLQRLADQPEGEKQGSIQVQGQGGASVQGLQGGLDVHIESAAFSFSHSQEPASLLLRSAELAGSADFDPTFRFPGKLHWVDQALRWQLSYRAKVVE